MRTSASTSLILSDKPEVPCGIMLEHNYCAEHEWGVADLRKHMGGLSDTQVAEKRICDFSRIRVKPTDKSVIWYEEKGLVILGCDDGIRWMGDRQWTEKDFKRYGLKEGDPIEKAWAGVKDLIPRKMTKRDLADKFPPRQTHSAWDQGSFGIGSREPDVMAFLRDLKDALLKGGAVLHISGTNNPFKPVSGLVLAIESRVPQEQKDAFEVGYQDRYKLEDAAKKTGIEAKLTKAGKQWFALTPKWATEAKDSVMFWLNPTEQRKNKSGWFTVEDLSAWIEGKGPIPTV